MTGAVQSPYLILGGGSAGNGSAGVTAPGQLALAYQNLLSGAADVISGVGAKRLVLTTGAIGLASPLQIGKTETASEQQANFEVLSNIAAFCRNNGIGVQVDTILTNAATYNDGSNAFTDMWSRVAAQAGLPIVSVEDVNEIGMGASPSTYVDYAAIAVGSIKTIIRNYTTSSYHLTPTNLAVGDMEGGGAETMINISQWWDAYNAAAHDAGLLSFSFVTADTGLFAPWVTSIAYTVWQNYLTALSRLTASRSMALNVIVQGVAANTSGNQFIQLAEQNAIELAKHQASGALKVDALTVTSWNTLPVSVGQISSPTSSTNEAAEIRAVYPLYAGAAITAQGPITTTAPGQIILNTGSVKPVVPLTIHWSAQDIAANRRLGVVIIDQTGALTAVQHGGGTVSNLASNILVLNGNAADLAAELSSVTLEEPNTGPDTIDIQVYSSTGRVSDDQISVYAAGANATDTIAATSAAQGWVSASVIMNTGTVISSTSRVTSETLTWSANGTLVGWEGTGYGQSPFLKVVGIHQPLAEYGVEVASATLLGTAVGTIANVFDPNVDDSAFGTNGYANYPGGNDIVPDRASGYLGSAFNPILSVTALIVGSTTLTFDPVSGKLQTTVDRLAPNPMTVTDKRGSRPNMFATAFNNSGTQITEINTGTNPGWQAGWGDQFSSATLTYDGSGRLVEEFLQGASNNALFTIDSVFDPASGQLWEQFQSTAQPPSSPFGTYATTNNPYMPGFAAGPTYVTQFNTGNNPNWNYIDWGAAASSNTEIWTDYFLTLDRTGFVVKLPSGAPNGVSAYPLQFVNGSTLDLIHLPGSIVVDLNQMGAVTIGSQRMASGLTGLRAIDAWGSTGSVTITGLCAGDSTLVGGDSQSTIVGFGSDTILAGGGQTTVATGSGGSTVKITNKLSRATLIGDRNTIAAVAGSSLILCGNGNTVNADGITLSVRNAKSSTNIVGNDNTVTASAGLTITATGTNELLAYSLGGTLNQRGTTSSAAVKGDNVTVWMNPQGGVITITGSHCQVTGGTNSVINLAGDFDVAGTCAGGTINVSGRNATLFGDRVNVYAQAGTTSITVIGMGNIITAGSGATIYINGPNNTIILKGANISLNSSVQNAVLIKDTAAEFIPRLTAMKAWVSKSFVLGINLADTGTALLSLSATQLVSSAVVLRLIATPYTITVAGALTISALNSIAMVHVDAVSVSDSAANFVAGLGGIKSAIDAGRILSIGFTDSGSPTLVMSTAQFSSALPLLSRVTTPYRLALTATSAANAARVGLPTLVMMSITDTAVNVTANRSALASAVASGRVSTITFIDHAYFNFTVLAASLTSNALAQIQVIEATRSPSVVRLVAGVDGTVTVKSASAITIVGADDASVINLGSGNAQVYLGSARETVNGGSGFNAYYVTGATIGATIRGGVGFNALRVQGRGALTMGNQITGIRTVFLDNGSAGSTFAANTTAGLTIQGDTGNDVVTIGAATQSVFSGAGSMTVRATAANASVAVHSGSGATTLEIITGGTAQLNDCDANLTVKLDAATHLNLGKASFITGIAAPTGNCTIIAGGPHQSIKSVGGNNTLIGSAFSDTFFGSGQGLNGDFIGNFGANDVIDVTDLNFSSLRPVSFNAVSGLLQVSDGRQGVHLSFGGLGRSSSFIASQDGHGGTFFRLSGH